MFLAGLKELVDDIGFKKGFIALEVDDPGIGLEGCPPLKVLNDEGEAVGAAFAGFGGDDGGDVMLMTEGEDVGAIGGDEDLGGCFEGIEGSGDDEGESWLDFAKHFKGEAGRFETSGEDDEGLMGVEYWEHGSPWLVKDGYV